MLQRAASNAYTWWWASHIRTKQSKWLEQSLLEMEEKVGIALQIIDQDGDSFAKRAEMYYKKRPELVSFVEEAFRAFRALAERYDHLSRDLQSANRKIATVFPEEVPFDVDDDDFDEPDVTVGSKPDKKQPKDLPDGAKARVPKVPAAPGKNFSFRTPSRLMSRKGPGNLRRTSTFAKSVATPATPTSGLTKDEAMMEIDKLQKEILSFQTEKEFVKSSFERGRERYWEIENRIMEMQRRVCTLQDEFEIGLVIEDSDARKLMVSTALKSCRDSLAKLQERHRKSEDEVRVEEEKIERAYEKFEAIRGEEVPRRHNEETVWPEPTLMKMEEIDGNLTVPELAEKVDDLVNKVVNLEVEVSTQSASVGRLRSETEHLLGQIHKLESSGSWPCEDDKMKSKLNEFEADLERVKKLKEQVLKQCQGLLSEFDLASSNLNRLSEKLENVKLDGEVEMSGLFREVKAGPAEETGIQKAEITEDRVTDADAKVEDTEDNDDRRVPGPTEATSEEEIVVTSGPTTTDSDVVSENHRDQTLNEERNANEGAESNADNERHEDDQPNWRQLFLNGIEDREKILLEEYTSILRSYKDVKNKLSDAEKKNRDGNFEMSMQIRELRTTNDRKEEEIKSLRQKLGISNDHEEHANHKETTAATKDPNLPKSSSARIASAVKQPLYKLLLRQSDRYSRTHRSQSSVDGDFSDIGRDPNVVPLEEKVRAEIDDLLEENMEFWMRFSTSIQQIQKFQTTFHDLEMEMSRLKINKKQNDGVGNKNASSVAEARAIYKHLREIQTEMRFWLEHHTLLNEELQSRCSALGNIQDEISKSLECGTSRGEAALTEYQAAKLQGEVLNMRQESNKVGEELEAGQERVKNIQAEIEKALSKLDEYLGLSTAKTNNPSRMRSSSTRSRIPLRYFLFGVKLRKQKQSIFACMSPAFEKQGSEITPGLY